MGQKVNPHGLRVGVIKDWDSRWYAREEKVGDLIVEDYNIRKYLKKRLYSAGIPKIEIERDSAKVKLYIHCSRPGVVIGKGGADIEKLRADVEKLIGKPVALNIVEVKVPDTNAQLVAENIAAQIEKRISHRRAMKNAMGRAMRMGVRGIKIKASGRLGGAEIARSETYHEGTIPSRQFVLTSSTALQRLLPPTVVSASRFGSTKAKFSTRLFAPLPEPWIPLVLPESAVRAIAAEAETTVRAAVTTEITARAASVRVARLPQKEETANAYS